MSPEPRTDPTLPREQTHIDAPVIEEPNAAEIAHAIASLSLVDTVAPSATDEAVESLPFDQYQRYRLVADLVRRVAGSRRLAVLDLGGRTGVLRRFLPDHDVALVDVERSDVAGLVLGDGSRLPFRRGAFDLVVACDTLEHVPLARRDDLLREAVRVARRGVILAGPYASPEVVEAEDLLRDFLREKLGIAHRYLDEHRDQGLPDLAASERALQALGARTAVVAHGNLERWLALQCLSLYMDEDPHLRAIAKRMFRFYNRALYASDHRGPVYRHALFAALGDEELPTFAGLFETPVALPATLAPFADLAAELAAFDRESDVYAAERERMEAVNRGLVRDLALHKQAKAVLERDLAGHKQALEEARARLSEHALSLAAVESDLAGHKELSTLLERDLDGHRRVAATLQSDLDGHRALLADVRREIGEYASLARELGLELSGQRTHASSLSAELEKVRGEARALELEAQRTNEVAVRVNAELVAALGAGEVLRRENAALRAEIERQHGELRSRWKNLKRALRWRK